MAHVLPAAGTASRIGGIPKFLLPIGPNSKSLLMLHIEVALSAGLEVLIVVNPLLERFVTQMIENAKHQKVKVIPFESISMTDTLKKAVEGLENEQIVSISMPDTFMPMFSAKDLLNLREIAPSLSIIETTQTQHSKLGQVAISNDGHVVKIVDKNEQRISDYAWTGFALKTEKLKTFPTSDVTPGLELARIAENSDELKSVLIEGQYFDCGTIDEYWHALGKSIDK
jgi:hypothetical protein